MCKIKFALEQKPVCGLSFFFIYTNKLTICVQTFINYIWIYILNASFHMPFLTLYPPHLHDYIFLTLPYLMNQFVLCVYYTTVLITAFNLFIYFTYLSSVNNLNLFLHGFQFLFCNFLSINTFIYCLYFFILFSTCISSLFYNITHFILLSLNTNIYLSQQTSLLHR